MGEWERVVEGGALRRLGRGALNPSHIRVIRLISDSYPSRFRVILCHILAISATYPSPACRIRVPPRRRRSPGSGPGRRAVRVRRPGRDSFPPGRAGFRCAAPACTAGAGAGIAEGGGCCPHPRIPAGRERGGRKGETEGGGGGTAPTCHRSPGGGTEGAEKGRGWGQTARTEPKRQDTHTRGTGGPMRGTRELRNT